VDDFAWCGFLDQYNDQYDKVRSEPPGVPSFCESSVQFVNSRVVSPSLLQVTTQTATQLKRVETKEFYPVTTTDDPVIEKLAIEGKGNVFATDAIVAHLMTCPR
jgi:translation initiation factor 3 subunit D